MQGSWRKRLAVDFRKIDYESRAHCIRYKLGRRLVSRVFRKSGSSFSPQLSTPAAELEEGRYHAGKKPGGAGEVGGAVLEWRGFKWKLRPIRRSHRHGDWEEGGGGRGGACADVQALYQRSARGAYSARVHRISPYPEFSVFPAMETEQQLRLTYFPKTAVNFPAATFFEPCTAGQTTSAIFSPIVVRLVFRLTRLFSLYIYVCV